MNDEPIRLRQDASATGGLRADLARVSDAQVDWDLAAGLARFDAAIASGATASASASGLARGAWWGLGGIGLAGLVAVAVSLGSARGEAPRSPARAQPNEGAASVEPEVPRPASVSLPVAAPAPAVATAAPRPPGAGRPDDWVAREIAQLAAARAALPSDPARALALAEAGRREFPRGVLTEEREAVAIFALERLGGAPELATRAARFLERYPQGPFSERVRRIAGEGALP